MSILDNNSELFEEYDAKTAIQRFLDANFIIYGTVFINDDCEVCIEGTSDTYGSIYTRNPDITSLTNNGMFHFSKVDRTFGIVDCKVLKDISDVPGDVKIIFIKNSPNADSSSLPKTSAKVYK